MHTQQVEASLRPLIDPKVQAFLRQHHVADGLLEVPIIDLAFLVSIELVKHPLEYFVVETDAPVLEHVPHLSVFDLEIACLEVQIIEAGVSSAPL